MVCSTSNVGDLEHKNRPTITAIFFVTQVY